MRHLQYNNTVRRILAVLSAFAAAVVFTSAFAEPEGRDWSQVFCAFNPSVSPDGRYFAFEWKDRVWLAPTAGGTAVPVGDGTSTESRPKISPDGKRVAFLSDRWGTDQLFEAELDIERLTAGNVRQVTFHTEGLFPWGYTPDGSHMIALAVRDDASESTSSKRISRRPILVSMGERRAEQLLFDAPAFAPSLSPDGRKVLFASKIEERGLEFRKRHDWSKTSYAGDIWLYDRDSGAFTPVVRRSDNCTSPIWTPDGTAFYYLCDAGGVRNIYCRTLATGEERQITRFSDDHIFGPSLSRDGRTMVFANGLDLWRIDPTLENPEPQRIALSPAFFDPCAPRTIRRSYTSFDNNYGAGNCTFRDNGKEVAFTAGGDVWVMELRDEDRQPLCIHGASRTQERDCAFSPDGDTLYYLSSRGDGTDLFRVRRADTNRLWSANTSFVRECILSCDACLQGLSVSPDGRFLAWHDSRGRLSFADTNGVVRAAAKVATAKCDSYAWSPDGRYVAAALKDGHNNSDVWIVPTWDVDENGEKAPEPCNISRNYKWDGTPAWSPDGRIVAFSGDRTATGDMSYVFYAYLDPADEHAEAAGGEVRKEPCRPDFATLPDRVRATGAKGYRLCFSPDGRTLSFYFSGDKKMYSIKIPGRMKAERLLDKDARIVSWLKDGGSDRILSSIDSRPAVGDKTFTFNVYQTTGVQDYQELAFLTAWANLRDNFCDVNMHGADWPAVREKYRLAARNAPCWSAFSRTVRMMNGELDASHIGFWANDVTKGRWSESPWKRGWKIFTCHLGARFDRSHSGEGWLVRDVIPGSHADKGAEGLLPGDVVVSVDGLRVSPEMDYAEVMNGPLPHKYRLEVRRAGSEALLSREIDAITFEKARRLLRTADVESARAAVREKGNFGYIAMDAMNAECADTFADQVFAECFGKDGLVVDVRFNTGGRTADRLIDMLCGNRHTRFLYRGIDSEGYLMDRYGRPVIADLPVVVLANERSQSNAEEFTHAMQSLKRAKVVGLQTAGDVIACHDCTILDYGVAKCPHIGCFLPDGRDMEGNGAKPDIEVDMTPADIAAGRDPQLAAALDVLASEVAGRIPPPPLKFSPGAAALYMAGDSIMTEYKPAEWPQYGWGQSLAAFMKDPAALHNFARSGWSARRFRESGRWEQCIASKLRPGDWVIVSFGHNDMNKRRNKPPKNDYSTTDEYKAFLRGFASDVKAKGANIAFATSIAHSSGFAETNGVMTVDGGATGLGAYVAAMREVAAETGSPLLDLNKYAVENLPKRGLAEAQALYMFVKPGEYANYPNGKQDAAHVRDAGAYFYARAAVEMARSQGLALADLFKAPEAVPFAPSVAPQAPAPQALAPLAPHPRLFTDAAGFDAAKARLESTEVGRKALASLMKAADEAIGQPVLERKMEGKRLLGTSRKALERIGNLAFAWRATGERKYADRAIAEAKAVAAFSDWNPSHFLDVGEMTLAVAVARDWLDDALDDADKRLLAEAILMKGLTKGDGETLHSGWWTTTDINWNQVCNGGLAAGAAAVREDFPKVAEAVLRRSRECLPLALATYEGGNFPEGPGYWSYAANFAAIALDVLSHQFADGAPELFAADGLAEQCEYIDLVTGPTGLQFNYSDPFRTPFAWRGPIAANCYFGMKFGRGGGFASEAALVGGNRSFGRMAAFALLWSLPPNEASAPEPVLCRLLGGRNPLAILRSGLERNDWYVGVKGGSPSASHGHMDVGSFVLDAGGVRWACDLGCEEYGRIEAMKTIDLWNMKQDSSRWSLFRLGLDGHGTLAIDGAPQKVDGCATFVGPVAPTLPAEAILDIAPVYPAATKATRAFSLERQKLVVSDRLAGLKPGAVVTWNMNTPATATARGNVLELEAKDGNGEVRRMTLAASPAAVQWTVAPLDEPRTPADSPNPGISRVAFSVVADESGDASIAVEFAGPAGND